MIGGEGAKIVALARGDGPAAGREHHGDDRGVDRRRRMGWMGARMLYWEPIAAEYRQYWWVSARK